MNNTNTNTNTIRAKLKKLKGLIELYISKETIVAMFISVVFMILVMAVIEEDFKMVLEVLKVFSAVLGVILSNVL
jgi:hypothetical protein